MNWVIGLIIYIIVVIFTIYLSVKNAHKADPNDDKF